MATTGLTAWQVRIKQDTVRHVEEEAFLNDLWSAFLAVMADHRQRVAALRREVFDAPSQVARN